MKFMELIKLMKAWMDVSGIQMVKRHTKPSQNSAGGIIEKEAMINIANIAFYDEKKQKPSKIGFKILEDGRKVRVSKLTGCFPTLDILINPTQYFTA
mgnify:CR=1 FL=1